jgi:hypothetical protein
MQGIEVFLLPCDDHFHPVLSGVVKMLTEGYAFSFSTSTPHPQLLIISRSNMVNFDPSNLLSLRFLICHINLKVSI